VIVYQIKHLIHYYNDTNRVLDIDEWQLAGGGITGLTGPNGSGKSTLLTLLGLVQRPTRGEIFFKGVKTDPFSPGLRGRIALLPQETYLLKRSIYKNIAYGLSIRQDTDQAGRVREAMGLVGLPPERFADRPWFALSGGEARRVALAARLALHPEVLLLDEPTAGVDDASARLMKKAILHAFHHWDTRLIIASHDANWLQDVCTDMMHLYQGRLMGRSRTTLLHGPWKTLNDRHLRMQLTEAQFFVAAKPPSGTQACMAAIDPGHLSIVTGDDPRPSRFFIEGVLVSLSLDKPSGDIEAYVAVGDTHFRVLVSADRLSTADLFPGRKATIAYDPDNVLWC
jgi:tungstate transport system ATP-binding protein